jgi:hypothetical protein
VSYKTSSTMQLNFPFYPCNIYKSNVAKEQINKMNEKLVAICNSNIGWLFVLESKVIIEVDQELFSTWLTLFVLLVKLVQTLFRRYLPTLIVQTAVTWIRLPFVFFDRKVLQEKVSRALLCFEKKFKLFPCKLYDVFISYHEEFIEISQKQFMNLS